MVLGTSNENLRVIIVSSPSPLPGALYLQEHLQDLQDHLQDLQKPTRKLHTSTTIHCKSGNKYANIQNP